MNTAIQTRYGAAKTFIVVHPHQRGIGAGLLRFLHDVYIERVDGHADNAADWLRLGGVYQPLVVDAVDGHFVVHALEYHRFHDAGELRLLRGDNFDVLRADNNVHHFVPAEALVDALEPFPRELDEAVLRHAAVDDVAFADEVRDERVDRLVINIDRRAYLLNVSVVHYDYGVAHGEGFLLVVGDVDEGKLQSLLYLAQFGLHLLAELEVERAERLVQQQDFRVVYKRPCYRDALLLAAGKTLYRALFEPGEVHKLQHFSDAADYLFFADLLYAQSEGDVLVYVKVREQRVLLEHRVYVALVGRQVVYAPAVKHDVAGGRRQEPADDAQRGGLAAARRTQQRHELLVPDIKIYVFQDLFAVEFHDDVVQADNIFHDFCLPTFLFSEKIRAFSAAHIPNNSL